MRIIKVLTNNKKKLFVFIMHNNISFLNTLEFAVKVDITMVIKIIYFFFLLFDYF